MNDVILEMNHILIDSMEECEESYPKHIKTVLSLWNCFIDSVLFKKYSPDKFHKYIWKFSDFIAKKYFPNEIDDFWRRPIKLEMLLHDFLMKQWEKLEKENPKFNIEFVEELEKQPFYKNDPIAQFMGDMIIGRGLVSTEELAEVLDISKEELNNQTEKLIKKGILKEGKHYYQTDLDYFKE